MEQKSPRVAEAATLAHIGAALSDQSLRVAAILPADLAQAARQAWWRDDDDPTDETARTITRAAGQLALIGLAVVERGTTQADGTVRVALDAWQIGSALDAAEAAGILDAE